jgi:hypothetical protein
MNYLSKHVYLCAVSLIHIKEEPVPKKEQTLHINFRIRDLHQIKLILL